MTPLQWYLIFMIGTLFYFGAILSNEKSLAYKSRILFLIVGLVGLAMAFAGFAGISIHHQDQHRKTEMPRSFSPEEPKCHGPEHCEPATTEGADK